MRRGFILGPVATALGLLTAVAYVVAMHAQGDDPVIWYLALVVGGSLVVAIATGLRSAALWTAGGVMLAISGILGLLSVGLPAAVGAGFAFTAALRSVESTPRAA